MWTKKAEDKKKKSILDGREEMTDKLTELLATSYQEDVEQIANLIRYGFKGLENMTDQEFQQEWAENFTDDSESEN